MVYRRVAYVKLLINNHTVYIGICSLLNIKSLSLVDLCDNMTMLDKDHKVILFYFIFEYHGIYYTNTISNQVT